MAKKDNTREVAIVHYNTPELTEAAILSLRRHGGEDYHITILDNSDERPWKRRMKGVRRLDNTKGKYVDFEKELAKYPDREPRHAMLSNYGSFKHIISVQKLWELIGKPFLLMESDILIRKPIDFLFDDRYAATGKIQWHQPGNIHDIPRLLPHLCWMNVPLLVANGARYFDPMRCWALQPGERTRGNWYDTGAALLEDIRNTKPQLVARIYKNLGTCYVHYHGGSWRKTPNDLLDVFDWLMAHEDLWEVNP